MQKALAEPPRGRGGVEVGAAVTDETPDFPGAGDLRGNTTCEVVADTIDDGAVVDAPAAPVYGLGDEVDPVALHTSCTSRNIDEVNAAGDGAAELPQGLSYHARTEAISVQKGVIVAYPTKILSTRDAPFKTKGLTISAGKELLGTNNP